MAYRKGALWYHWVKRSLLEIFVGDLFTAWIQQSAVWNNKCGNNKTAFALSGGFRKTFLRKLKYHLLCYSFTLPWHDKSPQNSLKINALFHGKQKEIKESSQCYLPLSNSSLFYALINSGLQVHDSRKTSEKRVAYKSRSKYSYKINMAAWRK